MREADNISAVVALKPDYMGFIFYPKSPRYVGEDWDKSIINTIPESITRVGVFVNETIDTMTSLAKKYGLKALQLHGNESPELCQQLQNKGYIVFKAFQVDEGIKLSKIAPYKGTCDMYLYDTKSEGLGGSGHKFDWGKLKEINQAGPFLLSGGITSTDADEIKKLILPNLKGVDINSRFEIEPALKDIDLLTPFIDSLR